MLKLGSILWLTLSASVNLGFKLSNLWRMDYLKHWDSHLTDFWVPAIVAVIFLICFFQSLVKKKIFLMILYLVLVAACVGYIGTGSQSAALNAVEGLVGH